MADKCKACAFFRHNNPKQGYCRRYPPQIITEDDEDGLLYPRTLMPVVTNTWWCGEFKLKKDMSENGDSHG